MTAPVPGFTIVSQVHVNKWMVDLQRAVPGWEVTVRDTVTGVIVPVFVDDEHYSADNVRTLAEAALAPVREVHALNR